MDTLHQLYSDIIFVGLLLFNRLKIEHLKTQSYSQHKLYEKTADKLMGLIDTFAESVIGECENMEDCIDSILDQSISLQSQLPLSDMVNQYIELLHESIPNSAIKSICDEIQLVLFRFKYLHRLQ